MQIFKYFSFTLYHHFYATLLFSFISLAVTAQDEEELPEPPVIGKSEFSIKLGAGLPFDVSNREFRTRFSGIYQAFLFADYKTKFNLLMGGGIEHIYFAYSKPMVTTTTLHNNNAGAYVILGHKKSEETSSFTIGLKGGYYFLNFKESDSRTRVSTYLERNDCIGLGAIGLYNFLIEENMGAGFYISGQVLDYVFDPIILGYIRNFKKNRTFWLSTGFTFSFGK